MLIANDKLYFRALEEEDLDNLYLWANNPEVQKMLCGWHFPGSKGFIRQWIAEQGNNRVNLRLMICSKDHQAIGTIGLTQIDWQNRNAYQGIMIGDQNQQGKGYGASALQLITDYAFKELDLVRLDTDIIEYNTRSINLFESQGWLQEGHKKNYFYREGKWWGRLSYGLMCNV